MEEKKYKILFLIALPLVILGSVAVFFRGFMKVSTPFILTVYLTLIILDSKAKKGTLLGLYEDPCQRYPFGKILWISFLYALIYNLVVWYGCMVFDIWSRYKLESLYRAVVFVYFYGAFFAITFIILFTFMFISLTVAWRKAKKNVYSD